MPCPRRPPPVLERLPGRVTDERDLVEIGGRRARAEQQQPGSCGPPPVFESLPRRVTNDGDLIEIVHAGSPEGTVRCREPGRLDDMRLDAEARGKAENRAGVLGDIGLVKGDPHALRFGRVARAVNARNIRWPKDLCDSWSFARGRACALFIRVPINPAGLPLFVLPQGLERPA